MGLPGEYPYETRTVPNDFVPTPPWILMTDEDVAARISQYSEQVRQITQAVEAVPQEIDRWKLRAALELNGYLAAVEAAINALPPTQQIVLKAKWAGQETVQRNHPTIIQLGAAIGLTPAQIDNIFIQASRLA